MIFSLRITILVLLGNIDSDITYAIGSELDEVFKEKTREQFYCKISRNAELSTFF